MASNIDVTQGSGKTVGTEEITSVQYQLVKLVDATAASTTRTGVAANPFQVSLANTAANATAVKVDGSAVAQPVTDNAGSLTVDNAALSVVGGGAEATAMRVTIANDSTGLVSVDDNAGSLTIDNAALSVTGGGVEASALRVTIASDSTGVLSIDDNAGSITVDGSITAVSTVADGADVTLGAKADAKSTATDTTAVTIMQVVKQISASVQAPPSQAVTNAGTFAVQAASTVADGSNAVEGVTTGAAVITDANGTIQQYLRGIVKLLITAGTVVLGTGTAAIGKLAANSGVDIGDVDVTSAVVTGGAIADDATTPGNPIMVGGFAISPDGTDPGGVAEADVARFRTDLNRRLLVSNEHPQHWSYHSNGSSALTDAAVAADPGDGYELVITEIIFSTGAATACNIFFEEGATTILGPWYLEAIAGRGVYWQGNKHVTASTALTVTTSAAIAQSVDVQGYIQKV